MFNLPNYKLIRADRKGRRGGGVAFYITQNINFKIRSDIKLTQAESLFIEINNSNAKNVIIGLIYRPPDSNCDLFCDELDFYLHKIGDENKQNFILGDFNINYSPSSDNSNSTNCMQVNAFIRLFFDY